MHSGKKRVMVFGVFDGCHEGHQYFLRESAKHGDKFIVVVARDETVRELKQKKTKYSLAERMQAIEELGFADAVVAGDITQHSWTALKEYKPDVVVLGHDQHALEEALRKQKGIFLFTIEHVQKYTQ